MTLYDPLRRYEAKQGTRVGIVGIGGLGQMGIKLAKALGCSVTAITRSEAKAAFAKKCGADVTILSNTQQMQDAALVPSLDLILNTIPNEHGTSPAQVVVCRTMNYSDRFYHSHSHSYSN